jgi:hypothetical protein
MTSFHETLRKRRTEAGMDEMRASFLLGLSVHEYDDLESHDGEWKTVTQLYVVLFACRLFGIDLMKFVPAQAGIAVHQVGWPGDIIRERRTQMGLSGPDFADRCGFTEQFTSVVETGDGLLIYPFDVTCIVCQVLGLEVASFFSKILRPII